MTNENGNSSSFPKSKLTQILEGQKNMEKMFNLKIGHVTEKLDKMVSQEACEGNQRLITKTFEDMKSDAEKLESWVSKISNRFWAFLVSSILLCIAAGVGLILKLVFG